jgi:tetratricopeptide (TPR) repeat protein
MKKSAIFAVCLSIVLLALSCSREPKTLDELRAAGQREFNDAHWSVARSYFQKALMKAPSDKQLLYLTGLCYKRESIYDSAVVMLKKADYLYPRDREINIALREVADLDGKWGYAIGAISVLIATGDKIENWYSDLARLSARNNEPLISMFYQRKLQKINHEDQQEWARLISVSLMIDSLPIAQLYLDSAIAKFGMNDELMACKGKVEGSLGHMAEAEKIFRTLYAKNPNLSANKYNLANVLSSAADKTSKMEAIELLRLIPEGERKNYHADSLIILIQKQVDKM